MIELVIGWVKDFFNYSKVEDFRPVETVKPSRSRDGYTFEHEELKRLMERLKGFGSVEFTDASGTPLTPKGIEGRFGKDGGIDCVIHIIAPTERGAKNVAARIRNILVTGDY